MGGKVFSSSDVVLYIVEEITEFHARALDQRRSLRQ